MRSKLVEKILKDVPLEIRIKVDIHSMLLTVLSDLELRDEESWSNSKEDQELLAKISVLAKTNTEIILNTIKQFEKDK